MFDEFGYGASAGGSARQQGRTAAQPPRVPQGAADDSLVGAFQESAVFVLGGNGSTLAVVNSFRPVQKARPGSAVITARLVPLAWTPQGVVVGDSIADVGIALSGLFDWIDRTFAAEDEHAFVASMRDLEMLVRIGWEAGFPQRLDRRSVLNFDDLPDEVGDALTRPPATLVQCAACRALCVRDDFVWKEKQLCAWDYHAAAFGKRGPWHEGPYEERHLSTIPACAYVVPVLLEELGAEEVLRIHELPEPVTHAVLNAAIAGDAARTHIVVRAPNGFVLLRER